MEQAVALALQRNRDVIAARLDPGGVGGVRDLSFGRPK